MNLQIIATKVSFHYNSNTFFIKQDLLLKKFLMEQEQSWEMREGNGKIKKQVRNKTSTHFWEK